MKSVIGWRKGQSERQEGSDKKEETNEEDEEDTLGSF